MRQKEKKKVDDRQKKTEEKDSRKADGGESRKQTYKERENNKIQKD